MQAVSPTGADVDKCKRIATDKVMNVRTLFRDLGDIGMSVGMSLGTLDGICKCVRSV